MRADGCKDKEMDRELRKLLLIEDNDDHAELTEFYITDCGPQFQVRRLRDGAEAMAYIEQAECDEQCLPWLVLLDLKLPKYDGHEVLRQLKKNPCFTKVPVVIFSTSNSNKDIALALNHHANSYIIKPMEAEKYGEVIKEMLQYWELNEHHHILCPPRKSDA